MPICIAGMHRSGTSMVARLLNLAGVYLGDERELCGPASDNEEGFWENYRFVEINEGILTQLNGGWDLPPAMPEAWETLPELMSHCARAAVLLARFQHREPWGWKDPRNTLTLPFWQQLAPGCKLVVCVRNPMEVAQSLCKRANSSLAFGMNLWRTYNQRLLATTPRAVRVVTHYSSYFHDAESELRRVLELLELPAPKQKIEQACAAAKLSLRHHRAAKDPPEVKPDVLQCYTELCAEAGPVYQAVRQSNGSDVTAALPTESDRRLKHLSQHVMRLEAELDCLRPELDRLRPELNRLQPELDRLRPELERLRAEVGLLRAERTFRGILRRLIRRVRSVLSRLVPFLRRSREPYAPVSIQPNPKDAPNQRRTESNEELGDRKSPFQRAA
jgi:hypothetical protein